MNMKRRRTGFTLIELSVSSLVVALIALILVMVFRSNLTAWKWGQKHMEFNQKIQLAMKQIFTDIKAINPLVTLDMSGDMWFQGEKPTDLMPHLVTILDTDHESENGGEQIVFFHTSFSSPSERTRLRFYLEEGALIRETTDGNDVKKKTVIADQVSNLFFKPNSNDIYEVEVAMTITDNKNPDLKEDLKFAVRLDTHLVCVKMISKDDDAAFE